MLTARDERRADGLRLARRQVERLTRLVDDLADLVHLRAGQLGLRVETVALATVIDRALATARGWLEPRRQPLMSIGAQEGLRIRGDPDRLEQMLGSLLQNASKFSEDGQTIALAITTDATHVRIDIRDDGAGISADRLASLFEPFHEPAGESAASWHGGLGIGLPMARGLAELHGGRLTLHSDGPGHGTTASLWLPLDPAPLAEPTASRSASDTTPPLRILLVEDADLRDGLTALLAGSGHDVRPARTGTDALAAAHRRPFDVILFDVGLPDAGARELAARLRNELPAPRPLFVALSGHDATAATPTPFDHQLSKPIAPAELAAFLKAIRHG